jgi:hypothetical protein
MNIAKLKYTDKETAIADLLAKKVYIEVENLEKEITLQYGQGIQAVVEIGLIMITPPVMDGMEVIEEPIYADGYHYDVMSIDKIDFGSAEIFPKNCCHSFAGYEQDADGPIELLRFENVNNEIIS